MAETHVKSKPQEEEEEDLISELPDEILTNILSFVNTNSAVATSVLSKRWKHIWISVPNLEIDNYKWKNYWDERYDCSENPEIDDFETYVDRILSINNVVSVRNLKLDCHNTHASVAASWLESLSMRMAERYHLYFPRLFLFYNILLPNSFFNHNKSLVELNLRNAVVNIPTTVCFPCLKTVTLNNVRLVDESMENLLSGCPVITDFSMRAKARFKYKKLCICSSTLKNLQIHAFCYEIFVDAPNVSYLQLENHACRRYVIILNLPSLVKASLHVSRNKEFLYEVLGKISHVEELILDGYTTKAVSRSCAIQEPGMLPNLTHITVTITKHDEVYFWLRLLTHTPLGVNIIFKLVGAYRHSGWCNNKAIKLPRSLKSCITDVKIVEVYGYEWMSVVTCNLECEWGSNQLIFHGLPISNLQANFFKKFLPSS